MRERIKEKKLFRKKIRISIENNVKVLILNKLVGVDRRTKQLSCEQLRIDSIRFAFSSVQID